MNRPEPLPSMRASNAHNELPRSRKEYNKELSGEKRDLRARKVRHAAYFVGAVVASSVALNAAYTSGVLDAALGIEPKNEEVSALAADMMDNEGLIVRCDDELLDSLTPPDEKSTVAGAVRPIDNSTIYLREKVCDTLEQFTDDGKVTAETMTDLGNKALLASYIEILGHEGIHTEGIIDEAQTSCYSVQKLPGILESIGYDAEDALDQAQSIAYLRQLDPPEYLSAECRPGGAYDLQLSPAYIISPETPTENLPMPVAETTPPN